MLQGFAVGLNLGDSQPAIAKDVGCRFDEIIHRQSGFLSVTRAKVPTRWEIHGGGEDRVGFVRVAAEVGIEISIFPQVITGHS